MPVRFSIRSVDPQIDMKIIAPRSDPGNDMIRGHRHSDDGPVQDFDGPPRKERRPGGNSLAVHLKIDEHDTLQHYGRHKHYSSPIFDSVQLIRWRGWK